ncbi:hypothetical protein [Mesorhizobium sp.]|nr:hypothetical protein [Mesorhizobium sp.]
MTTKRQPLQSLFQVSPSLLREAEPIELMRKSPFHIVPNRGCGLRPAARR